MGKEERGHCLASYLFLAIVLCFSSVSKNWRSTFEILKIENMHITHNFLSHRNVSLSSTCLNSSLFQECTQCFCKENETFLFFKAKLIIACKLIFIVLLERERGSSMCWLTPQRAAVAWAAAAAESQEWSRSPTWMSGTKHLSHRLLPPRVCTNTWSLNPGSHWCESKHLFPVFSFVM